MSEFDNDNDQRVLKAQADAQVAEAKAREAAAKQKVKDQKSKSRAQKAKAFGKLSKGAKIAIAAASAVVVVVVAATAPAIFSPSKGVTVSEATLKDAVAVSKLSTAEFTYEGIAEKTNDQGDVDYHIYYKATANSGIDMSEISFAIDEAAKTITPSLPAITIGNPVIDESSLDYLPKGASVDMREVLDVCKADMQREASQNSGLLQTAESNLRATIEALLMPILGNSGYSVAWEESAYAETEGDGDETD